MKTISRHAIDAELAQEGVESEAELLDIGLNAAATRAQALSGPVSAATRLVGDLSATGGEISQLCRALRLGAQAAAAIFSLAHGTGIVELTLGDRRVRLPATGPTDATHVGNWRTGWWLATI